MKSHIELAKVSDSFVTDKVWKRVVIDREELIDAVRDNNVQGLVYDVLRKEYGHYSVYRSLVNDITSTIMECIAVMLQKGVNNNLIYVLDDTTVGKAEEAYQTQKKALGCLAYWQGEMRS